MALSQPHGVSAAVVIEASAWIEDNAWVLELVEQWPFVLAYLGNIDTSDAAFSENPARLAAHPLFRGIRVHGNGFALSDAAARLAVAEQLAALDLTMDVLGRTDIRSTM